MKKFQVFKIGDVYTVFIGSEFVASFETEFAASIAADQLNRTLGILVDSYVGAQQAQQV